VLAPYFVANQSHYKVSEKAKMKKAKKNSDCMVKTHVFAISGFSGSGKTTLLSKLVKKLSELGKSVSVIKNSKEDILAPVDTDTRHHQDAGANPVILLGPNTTTTRYRERKELFEILSSLETDYLLLEGFKETEIPRFWCISENEEVPDSLANETKAIVGWHSVKPEYEHTEIPYFTHSEIDQLLELIEHHAPSIHEIENMLS
jgi:molybdopterin-guanine dinucleotide biosynthesis protein B